MYRSNCVVVENPTCSLSLRNSFNYLSSYLVQINWKMYTHFRALLGLNLNVLRNKLGFQSGQNLRRSSGDALAFINCFNVGVQFVKGHAVRVASETCLASKTCLCLVAPKMSSARGCLSIYMYMLSFGFENCSKNCRKLRSFFQWRNIWGMASTIKASKFETINAGTTLDLFLFRSNLKLRLEV